MATMDNILLQWNINGVVSHLDQLQCLVRSVSPLIVCLQESRLSASQNPKLKNFDLYRFDFTGGGNACDGVCTFVHNTCHSSQVNITSNLQCVAIQVKLPYFVQPLSICNVYIPPHTHYLESDLSNIKNQLKSPFIIVGDFNAHNPLWGDCRLDFKGKEVEKFILNQSNVHLLNSGDSTHYSLAHLSHSAIDLSFCSTSLFQELVWSVEQDLYFSGHFPIKISCPNANLPSSNQLSSPSQKIWNYERANWDLFRERIDLDFDNELLDVDTTLQLMNTNILSAAEAAIPEKKIPSNRLPVPWWDEEIKDAIKTRRKCLRAVRRRPTIENKIAFMRTRAISRRLIKSKKRQGWSEFVGSIDHSVSPGEMFHKMGKLRGKYTPRHISAIQDRTNPGTLLYDSIAIADTLGSHFSSVSSNSNYANDFISYKESCERSPINFDFSMVNEYNKLSLFIPGNDECFSFLYF